MVGERSNCIEDHEDADKLIIICESDAALGGTNKTKAYQDGGLRNGDELTYIKVNDGEYKELKSWVLKSNERS